MLRVVTLAIVTALMGLVIAAVLSDSSPRIDFDETVPDDLRALAVTTWDEFVQLHAAKAGCIGPVTLSASWNMESRAEYQPGSSLIVVRVPGTPATLRSQMVHEFAHHIEHTCDSHLELRADFLEAQGFSNESAWFEGASWETTPSEHYAEATVELILGMRHHHGNILVTDEAIEVVRHWAADR